MTSTKEQQRRVRDYRARRTVHERKQRRLKRDNVIAIAAVVVVGTLAGLGQWWYADSQPTDDAASASESPAPTDEATASEAVPDPSLAEGRDWTGSLTINGIELGIQLDGAAAPQAVSAVIEDIQTGYYAGKTCHRLTTADRFEVLQCGSLDGTGAGDPDYQYGPIENAPADDVYPAGTIAMARAGGDPNSNGHQFFIVYGDTDIPADAAGGYTVIGTVTSGLDQLVSDVISAGTTPVPATGVAPEDGAPLNPVTIDAATVE
ncbi:peptidylprolyl isomerase [Agrococcus jejuensis]|uniref:peptidylprolyl isomerase n=1 Tax=Agrococcus jejuensis TaxID=399736 RepID=UPI0021B5BEA2|nr:peptidylprolyl isomerase [Agrococcus jejuensis]